MDVMLRLEGLDLHSVLSSYSVVKEVKYQSVITTLDDVEHPFPAADRDIIEFALFPLNDQKCIDLYNVLGKRIFQATYTDPHSGAEKTRTVRVDSNINLAFGLRSIDGNRYYKGDTIRLRQN